MPRLFFATDIHGSDICWRKFLNAGKFYEADVLVLGGDMTGKALVPILALPEGGFKATLLQQEFFLPDEGAVADMERRVKSRGYYPFRVTAEELAEFEADPAKVDAFFHQQMLDVVEQWMALADERLDGSGLRCYVCPGNDDAMEVDEVVCRARHVELAEGRVVELGDGFQMISTGWSNITPWKTYREASEEDLAVKIEQMVGQLGAKPNMAHTVFNFHCPPYGSNLDEAPEIDDDLNVKEAGRSLVPVGSTAVRDAILRHQPVLTLHGHIHEGKGTARLGKTLAINAGSLYEQGVLQGAVVDLDKRRGVRSYLLTTG
ncbi:MAG: metallophosphoesterase [Chloroflexi bacterium]|jgi:Icc-related predicted phosphoesterase|nr:metallophosphoesterase [Chloroflexota bacterium]